MQKYDSIDSIPAKLFFKVLKDKDFTLISKKNFERIYDDFFLKSENGQAKLHLKLINEITLLRFRIATIENVLIHLQNRYLSQEQIKELKEKAQVDKLPFFKNDLKIKETMIDELSKGQSDDFDFYDSISVMGQILNRTLDENMTLAMYLSFEKLTKKAQKK